MKRRKAVDRRQTAHRRGMAHRLSLRPCHAKGCAAYDRAQVFRRSWHKARMNFAASAMRNL